VTILVIYAKFGVLLATWCNWCK